MGRVENSIQVELAWSPSAGTVKRLTLALPQRATIADAIAEAMARGGWDLQQDLVTAVWGRARKSSYCLDDGDRLELLRPLLVDPMEARRRRYRGVRQDSGQAKK